VSLCRILGKDKDKMKNLISNTRNYVRQSTDQYMKQFFVETVHQVTQMTVALANTKLEDMTDAERRIWEILQDVNLSES